MLKSNYLSAMGKYLNKEHTYNESIFVKKVTGKGLSTNDYSTAEQTKLAGIAAGAEANVIDSITVNNTAISPDANKNVNIDMSPYYIKPANTESIIYKYKGSVLNYDDWSNQYSNAFDNYMDATDAGNTADAQYYASILINLTEKGSVFNVEQSCFWGIGNNGFNVNAGDNVVYVGSYNETSNPLGTPNSWEKLSGTIDMSNYVQVEQGKGLSHIDVTQTMKDTWDSIDDDDDVLDSDFDSMFPSF